MLYRVHVQGPIHILDDAVLSQAQVGRRRPCQSRADLQREWDALNKLQRGVALAVEGMEEVPDKFRRAFAFALARLADTA